MNNPFATLQGQIAARLAADAWLAGLPVITEDKGDIQNLVDQALAGAGAKEGETPGKSGLALTVLTPGSRAAGESGDGNVLDIVVQVEVVEQVMTNTGETGTGQRALDVVFQVYALLQGWAVHPGAAPGRFVQYASSDEGGTLRYILQFTFTRTPKRTLLVPQP